MMAGAVAAAAMAGSVLAVIPAQAQTLVPGVTGCSASGNKQVMGAGLGAVAGGLLGNSIAGHNRTTGTLLGAAAGAAAGSAVGCQMQKGDAQRAAAANEQGDAARTYSHQGYQLESGVEPANYQRLGQTLVATSTVNLRAAPNSGSPRMGGLRRGERFEAMAQVRGGEWILVGRDGVGIGYVNGAYVRSEGARYASY
jgi:outer membrane lipoprotein SlyB